MDVQGIGLLGCWNDGSVQSYKIVITLTVNGGTGGVMDDNTVILHTAHLGFVGWYSICAEKNGGSRQILNNKWRSKR